MSASDNPAHCPWMSVAPAVASALQANSPVVAFETTVLSFGLPWPANFETGKRCEAAAQSAGAVPATLGMMNGQIIAGLSDDQIKSFCTAEGNITKVNLQNMAAAIMGRGLGAFTVAASTQVCSLAGIPVFATGGIGGVHRNFGESHDVSSDLIALARYPVAVVCAGVKSILDVPATLEHLETLGVPVIGYQTRTFPLFHVRESNYEMETTSDSLDEIAALIRAHWAMGGHGVLVVTPVPEDHAVAKDELEDWIAGAQRAAQIGRVSGKAVTPFLLKKLEELSRGKSITTNVALLENNAAVAGQLARSLAKAAL